MADDLHSSAEVARRVQQVLEGAERAALEILREAQERARLEDARIAERAEAVRGEMLELRQVAADLAGQVEAMRRQIELVQQELDAVSSADRPSQDAEPAAPADDLSPERLAAMQMAAARCSRAEVAEHLRRRYGVADAAPILDDLYGRQAV